MAALWNQKAAASIEGRKNLFHLLQKKLPAGTPVIWVHCSSAGEFEQGKPVIEELKKSYPSFRILLTFFSPSGMSAARDYQPADFISYLPFDNRRNAERFISIVNPRLAIFVKYEFWYHHLHAAAFRHIPILLISASFRKDQVFLKWYGRFYRQMLFLFRHIFVQNHTSLELAQKLGISNASISGDTRFDRVSEVAMAEFRSPLLETFISNRQVIVAGSTWPDDETLLALFAAQSKTAAIILVPHEISEKHLHSIQEKFPGCIRYSEYSRLMQEKTATTAENIWTSIASAEANAMQDYLRKTKVLVIDTVGMLSKLYRHATICYVGGGFTRDGIHNILEAAVYGKPVLFGPNYKKYNEAPGMIHAGGAFSISDEGEFKKIAGNLLHDQEYLQKTGAAAKKFIEDNTGATGVIMNYIQEKRLLTR